MSKTPEQVHRPRAKFDSTTFGATLWLFCLQFFAAEQIARAACTTPYSMTQDTISALGGVFCEASAAARAHWMGRVVCSPLHGMMNSSFMLQGFLIVFGALLVRRCFPGGRGFTLAIGLLVVSGVGAFLVGIAPEEIDYQVHIYGATANFVGANLGMMAIGIAMLRAAGATNGSRPARGWISFAMGAVGFIATLLLLFRTSPLWTSPEWVAWGLGVGTVERVAAYPLPLWLAGIGIFLLTHRSNAAYPTAPKTGTTKS